MKTKNIWILRDKENRKEIFIGATQAQTHDECFKVMNEWSFDSDTFNISRKALMLKYGYEEVADIGDKDIQFIKTSYAYEKYDNSIKEPYIEAYEKRGYLVNK